MLGGSAHCMPYLVLGDKYARAVKLAANAQPVVFPLADVSEVAGLLDGIDGVMLTGSASNVHPCNYGETSLDPSMSLDVERDTLTLALVRACLAQSVPLLGLCRGFQEINVALGGSLYQHVHQVPGLLDHREPPAAPLSRQYGPSHDVHLVEGSVLAQWAGGTRTIRVNSLHDQGVKVLAKGLRALAFSPDGLIEAFEVEGADTFAYAVQWHPEWNCLDTPFYAAIFKAFGQACQARQNKRGD